MITLGTLLFWNHNHRTPLTKGVWTTNLRSVYETLTHNTVSLAVSLIEDVCDSQWSGPCPRGIHMDIVIPPVRFSMNYLYYDYKEVD